MIEFDFWFYFDKVVDIAIATFLGIQTLILHKLWPEIKRVAANSDTLNTLKDVGATVKVFKEFPSIFKRETKTKKDGEPE